MKVVKVNSFKSTQKFQVQVCACENLSLVLSPQSALVRTEP